MARMHSRARGKAKSRKPTGRPAVPGADKKKVEKQVLDLANKGHTASEIGMQMRDEHSIPDVKAVTGKRVTQILADNKKLPDLPDDLLALIRKAVLLRKHLETNAQDKPAARGLKLTESKVMRLTKYYKNTGRIPQTWKYNPKEASYLAE